MTTTQWFDVAQAPEDEAVILATTGGHVGEAHMIVDQDTGEQVWSWPTGKVHWALKPIKWCVMPRPDEDERDGEVEAREASLARLEADAAE